MAHETAATLDSVPLLKELPQKERDDLVRQCRFRRYAEGEHIIDGQSVGRDVYFVVAGVVRVVNYSPSGREVAFDDIPAGNYFGELAALDGGPRSAFVQAQAPGATAAAMPPDVFIDLLQKYPKIGLEIMRRLARVIRFSTERIMDLSTVGANNRVHAELLRLAQAAGTNGNSSTISPIPHHADIASRVSTTRETVARVFSELTKAGMLERNKSALVVRDVDRLLELVEDLRGNF
jgi:CRP/FNR family cyclic AMP-dependent transcriptional regulator